MSMVTWPTLFFVPILKFQTHSSKLKIFAFNCTSNSHERNNLEKIRKKKFLTTCHNVLVEETLNLIVFSGLIICAQNRPNRKSMIFMPH